MYKLIKTLLSSLLPLGLALPTLLQAADPPTAPILRIETGMHTAPIKQISVDAAEQFLVTASEDKTLRLWELATGKLLTTYRIPIGEGNEGQLNATAIAPDGSWVAGAGWTGYEWDENLSIYLFNRQTGELERQLSGLENVVFHLCVSPDGQYLAATLGSNWGLRIWNTQTWQLVFRDEDYDESSYGCDFDSENRVVTTSYDGFIRLYTPTAETFNLMTKSEAPGGKRPFSIAFSPSSDQIAVGFVDSTSVNILDGSTLALRYAPDTSGVNDNLASVAWSQDGQGLYAGGIYYNSKGINPILHWSQPAQSSYVEWPAATNTIMDIHALKGGRVVYGAADPAFGVLEKDGNKVLERQSDIADYRGILDHFGISSEGSIVQFAFKEGGKQPARFSVVEQQLTLSLLADDSLLAPDTNSLNMTNWFDSYEPQLNGVSLPLESYEFSRSLAIAPDHSKFLLGTDMYLRWFDATGQPLWEIQTPGTTWGVNISGDGKTGLAALGDGTLRWYHLETGQELLAFFPHNDEKRWIVWTPSGYYMSSGEEANNLIGWQVNNGKDQAAHFYPISALNTSHHRPDILKKVLTTLDEAEAIRLANLEQGGEVEPPTDVQEGLEKVKDQYPVVLTPSGLGTAIIVAASGEQDSNSLFPYTNEFTQEMYRFLHDQGFSDGDIIYLNPLPPVVPSDGYTDIGRQDFPLREPTQELEQAIAKASQELQAGQQFIFYLHGHARSKSVRVGKAEELSAEQLKTLLATIPTNVPQTIILDTCHSGSFLTELAGVPNRILIASADADALAWSTAGGSFSEYFINQLRNGRSLGESFDFAKSEMAKDPTTFGNQSPQLDDTQDGSYDPTQDGQLARLTFLGGQKVHASLPPEIVTVHPPIQLAPSQQKATLWVTVVPSFEAIQKVRAILTNEHDQATQYQGETTPFTRRELSLKPNYSLKRYEVVYNQFDTAHSWKIRYEAQSMAGDWSAIKVGYVLAEGAAIPPTAQVILNTTTYHVGDPLRFEVTMHGTDIVDVYAGVIFPQGPYYTLAYPATFSPENTFQPYQREVALLGQSTLQVLNLTLPEIEKGEYQACALLTKPAADPKLRENWLSFHCQALQVLF